MVHTITSSRIYFSSLRVENVKCFGERQELRLTDGDGRLASWTLILGENGVGKTTLLQCLARMQPVPKGTKDEAVPDKIQPELNGEESNEILNRYIRNGTDVTLKLEANLSAGPRLGTAVGKNKNLKTCIILDRKNNIFIGSSIKGSSVNIMLKEEPYILGYGAARRMGSLNLDLTELYDPKASLLENHIELFDAEVILSQLDHAALKKKSGAIDRLEKLKQALADILPDIKKAKSISILGPRIPDSPKEQSGVRIETRYGSVPLSQLSLGSKTTLAWTVDIAWRMFQKYPNSANPMEEPAIVLVDEIDLHLHPRWQREIRANLANHFPNIQFIATAHSPLMAQTALDANLVVLREEGDHVVIENDPVIVNDWRVDQILTSELFDLKSARSLEIENLLKEREELLDKKRRRSKDNSRLLEIEKRLEGLPTAERREDQEAMDTIRKAATLLRGNGSR